MVNILYYVVFLGLFLWPGDATSDAPVSYEGSQIWQISKRGRAALELLTSKHIAMELSTGIDTVDLLIKKPKLKKAADITKKFNVTVEVLSKNVQSSIKQETSLRSAPRRRMVFNAYNRYPTMVTYIRSLPQRYPSLVGLQEIGKSVEGRSLFVLKIGNGNPSNKAIWIDGGIHAREWISSASVMYIIKTLTLRWESQPYWVKNITWHLLPMINPDGYEFSHQRDRFWRKNRRRVGRCYGVDLNRNFGYKWGGQGASQNPCDETFRGPAAFSEPESQAMRDYMLKMSPKPSAYLSYHSYGQYILYPWGFNRSVVENSAEMIAAGNEANRAINKLNGNSYRVAPSHILGAAAGGSDDWAKAVLGSKYSFTVELRDRGQTGFALPPSQIIKTSLEAFAIAEKFAKCVVSGC